MDSTWCHCFSLPRSLLDLSKRCWALAFWRYHIYSDPYKVCDDISSVKNDFRFPDELKVLLHLDALFEYFNLVASDIFSELAAAYFDFHEEIPNSDDFLCFPVTDLFDIYLVSHSSEHRMLISSPRMTMPWADSLLYFRCTVLMVSASQFKSRIISPPPQHIVINHNIQSHLCLFPDSQKNILIRNIQGRNISDHMH